ALAADQAAGAFLPTQLDIGENFFQLLAGSLRADHGAHIERAALLDFGYTLDSSFDELVVDGLLDQRTRRAGTDLALIQCKQRKTLQALVEILVIGVHDVGEEYVGRFSAQLQRHRN